MRGDGDFAGRGAARARIFGPSAPQRCCRATADPRPMAAGTGTVVHFSINYLRKKIETPLYCLRQFGVVQANPEAYQLYDCSQSLGRHVANRL